MSHKYPYPLAGETVTLTITDAASSPDEGLVTGAEFRVEDWADNLWGKSWTLMNGNFAAMKYGYRAGLGGLVPDDEVVYGKIGNLGHLVHISEIAS